MLGVVNYLTMKIWIHKADKRWWKYWKPTLLNTVGVKLDKAKPLYRWLWWGYCADHHAYTKRDLKKLIDKSS